MPETAKKNRVRDRRTRLESKPNFRGTLFKRDNSGRTDLKPKKQQKERS